MLLRNQTRASRNPYPIQEFRDSLTLIHGRKNSPRVLFGNTFLFPEAEEPAAFFHPAGQAP